MSRETSDSLGVVVIGRNEGERLRRCLQAVVGKATYVVYVDSGSTDGSVEFARSLGVEVVDLDLSQPFTMARGRNVGLEKLRRDRPELEFVQLVDGDCEIVDGWLEEAVQTLRHHSDIAVVCGRRRERFPDASLYNRLCDMEWATIPGETRACGGDAMMRVEAIGNVGGYNAAMIAGEEAELCVRLREHGWKILRLEAEMTLHDAGMSRFGQWWVRAVRSGHAYADGMTLHGKGREHHNVRRVVSALAWGVGGPVLLMAATAATIWVPWYSVVIPLVPMAYVVLWGRVYRDRRRRSDRRSDALMYSIFCVVAKVPVSLGIVKYWIHRLRGRRATLIEYKTGAA